MNDRQSVPQRKIKKKSSFILKLLLSVVVFCVSTIATFTYLNGFKLLEPKNFVLPYTTYKISLGKNFDSDIEAEIKNKLGKIEKGKVKRFEFVDNSEIELGWRKEGNILTKYIIPIANFYAITDDFNPKTQKVIIDSRIPQSIQEILKGIYLNASVVTNFQKSLDEDGKTVALIQARDLTYTYKLLKYNGKYFLDDKAGAITFSFGVNKEDAFLMNILKKNLDSLKNYEYRFDDIGKINQTGVTAITRALAKKIETVGDYGYPAKQVSSFLKDADFTHVSNEISFVPGCIPSDGMRFCSKPEYVKSLKDSGVDIVELTGNHNNDYGAQWSLASAKTYDSLGMKYFGGGKNIEDASKILYLESKGTKIAFLGYNYYDTMQGTGAIATKTKSGANSYSDKKLEENIIEARKNADIVIVDFQFQECYSYPASPGIFPLCYKPLTSPDQKKTFKMAIDFGADIVVGTQAHQPQTYELYNGKMIYYGLGNLFFDQAFWVGTRHGMILTHYYKEGKIIQTKITTTNYDINLQTYISKGSQRTLLLNLLKEAR